MIQLFYEINYCPYKGDIFKRNFGLGWSRWFIIVLKKGEI